MNQLEQDYGNDVRFLFAKLQNLSGEKLKNNEVTSTGEEAITKLEHLQQQIALADKILDTVQYSQFVNSFTQLKLDSKRFLNSPTQAKRFGFFEDYFFLPPKC